MTHLKAASTVLPEVVVIEPRVFGDDRGFFFESFNAVAFEKSTGVSAAFVQDNHSKSSRGVLRGLHYQIQQPQGKLVRVSQGEIYDVAVDIRIGSPTFGRWTGLILSAENKKQFWVPAGYAHGFIVMSATAEVLYKTTDYYAPEYERSIRWDDPHLNIDWPAELLPPTLSTKDASASAFSEAELPKFSR